MKIHICMCTKNVTNLVINRACELITINKTRKLEIADINISIAGQTS